MNRISLTMMLGTLSCLSFLSTAFADTSITQTSTTDISGTYVCNFHDPFSTPPDGTEYLTIKKGSNNSYRMSKKGMNDTTPSLVGIGLQNKEQNNAFSFLFWWSKDPTTIFAQYIIIKPDGTLEGKWAQSNKNQAATISCKKSS
ncbi:hypothetical protein DGG96_02835 [Legionella qingyii]|uniref:Uncharacterized protein n=2 Tax=Legionella qingyii TaxID=2184757 RepID=A0A317U547_9GAMM|nr:hypothetical protein DGG96_06355 [Legionella qingyii]PWY57327.1 hypothetical protein DGG96_02835 [Legionella qingyii]RUR25055.1 hypothetical protein ELY20_03845 [Legionella qingyii]RUR28899.1 hypothetical protein ELY16_02135 [Legionella qingyii]